jgi:TetR/AcrR family transcriptional regulator, cholesterol catabolism regulator
MAAKALKPRARTEAHDEKRALIIEGCATLFDKVGYHNTSMQMLADEVGLSKPTLYHYFPSKISILYAIHDAHINVLLNGLEGRDGEDPAAVLRTACVAILYEIATHPGYVRAFMDNYQDLEGVMKDNIRAARRSYFERIKSLIVEGIESGQFRKSDPILTTYAFVGMCNWAYKWYPAMAAKRSPEDVATALCDPLLNGLRAR